MCKELPIIFNAIDVLAVRARRKTQTRRVVDPQPEPIPDDVDRVRGDNGWWWSSSSGCSMVQMRQMPCVCPYGTRGDQLWVRETWRDAETQDGHECYAYRADRTYRCGKPMPADVEHVTTQSWKASTCMPRRASRTLLGIIKVRVQRVQDISEADILAEGVWFDGKWWRSVVHPVKGTPKCWPTARKAYQKYWDSLQTNNSFSFDSNPWVWAREFKDISDEAEGDK